MKTARKHFLKSAKLELRRQWADPSSGQIGRDSTTSGAHPGAVGYPQRNVDGFGD